MNLQVVPAGAVPSPVLVQQNPKESTVKGDISEYRGPGIEEFPYRAVKLLGAAQLIVALLILLLTIIQLSLGYGDRYVFLASAAVNVWTPIPGIAAGVVGLCVTSSRYWEVNCLKWAFLILSLLNGGVFMVTLLFVEGIITSYYYDITDIPKNGDVLFPPETVSIALIDDDSKIIDRSETQLAIVGSTLALGLLAVVFSFISVIITCFCASTYKLRDKAVESKLLGAHNPKLQRGSVKTPNDPDYYDEEEVRVVVGNPGANIYPAPPAYSGPLYGTLPGGTIGGSMYGGVPGGTPSLYVVN